MLTNQANEVGQFVHYEVNLNRQKLNSKKNFILKEIYCNMGPAQIKYSVISFEPSKVTEDNEKGTRRGLG